MSHRNNDNNIFLILLLCFLFPEVAAAIGLGYIFLWILKMVFYAIVLVALAINTYWPIILGIIFVSWLVLRKNDRPLAGSTKPIPFPDLDIKSPKNNIVRYVPTVSPRLTPSSHLTRRYVDKDTHDEDEEISDLMENHDLDRDEAEHVRDLMDEEGLDEDEAVELKDDL